MLLKQAEKDRTKIEYLKKLLPRPIKTAKPEVHFYFPYEDINIFDLRMENEDGIDRFENVCEINFYLQNGEMMRFGINETLTRRDQIKITEKGLVCVRLLHLYSPEIKKEEY